MKFRFLCALTALCLLCGAAQAALPEHLEQGFTADITGEVKSWSPFKDATLAALKGFFSSSALRLSVGEEGAAAALYREGENVLALRQSARGLWLSPTDTLYRGNEEDIVSATGIAFPGAAPALMLRAPDMLFEALNGASDALPAPVREVKGATDFKGAGRAHTRAEYTLSSTQWSAFFHRLADSFARTEEWRSSNASRLQAALSGLAPQGDVTVKRYFAKSGDPLAWTVSGAFSHAGGAPQKASFSFATSALGMHFSLKWGDSADASLNLERKKDAVKADGRAVSSLPGLSGAASLRASLSTNGGLRGSLSVTVAPSGQKAVTWTAAPKLALKEGGRLEGPVGLTRTQQKRRIDLTLHVSCSPETEAFPAAAHEKDAASMTAGERTAEQAAIAERLARALLPYVFSIPQDARPLVLHELGRHLRANGDTLPPVSQQPPYLVKEDPQP